MNFTLKKIIHTHNSTSLICKKKKKQQHKYNSPLAENKNSLTRVNLSLAIGAIGILIWCAPMNLCDSDYQFLLSSLKGQVKNLNCWLKMT